MESIGTTAFHAHASHGNLIVRQNKELADLELPMLGTVNGDFIVTDNKELVTLNVAKLARAGRSAQVTGNPKLAALVSPSTLRVQLEDSRGTSLLDYL